MARYIHDPYNPSLPPSGPRVYLRRERLDRQGYTSWGRYFGAGRPLFRFWTDDGEIDDWVRANDREEAKERIWREIPNAIFFR